METMERDPLYIAQQVRFARRIFGLTQENLAEASGLTTRTIEKVESGRHRPDEQTIRSLARAVGVTVDYFQKSTPEQEAKQKAELQRAIRKTIVVSTAPIRTAAEFMSAVGERDAFRFDTSSINNDEVLKIAAELVDFLTDLLDVWNDCPMSSRLEWAKSFVEGCAKLEKLGFRCYIGHHRQILREKGRSDLVFAVGLMSFQPKQEDDGTRYAIVHLEGNWETAEADRPIPSDLGS